MRIAAILVSALEAAIGQCHARGRSRSMSDVSQNLSTKLKVIGTSLNQYQITAKLGAGGMGEVFRARDTRLNRDVAIKVLPQSFAQDKERLARFEREAKALAA